jgi:hypothetical protein
MVGIAHPTSLNHLFLKLGKNLQTLSSCSLAQSGVTAYSLKGYDRTLSMKIKYYIFINL